MKIYEYKGFPGPQRVRMFLAEKGISDIDFEQVDVPAGEHRQASFLAKNPSGAVPVLELKDGTCISETVAISRYFEERHPEPPLTGTSAKDKAEIEMWLRRVEHTMYDAISTYFHHGTPGLGELETYQNDDWGQKNKQRYHDALVSLDAHLEGKDFIAAGQYSIADITAQCAVLYASFVEMGIPADLKNLTRWHAAVSTRPSATA